MNTKTSKYSKEQLEEELQDFHNYLKQNNFTDDEIRQLFKPLIDTVRRAKVIKILTVIASLLAALLMLYFNFETIYWHATAISRIVLIRLLPYWDWRVLKYQTCIISKYYEESSGEAISFNCNTCETITSIDAWENLKENEIRFRYLDLDIPVILSKVKVDGWPRDSNIITSHIHDDPVIKQSYPCFLESNIVNKEVTVGKLIETTELFQSFFVHFQNCERSAVKHFRTFFPRPSFLYAEMAPIQFNWFLWNKDYNTTNYKKIELVEKFGIIGQVSGSNHFILRPRKNCEDFCTPLGVKLESGEFLLISSMWDLEYKPHEKGENVAVILETH